MSHFLKVCVVYIEKLLSWRVLASMLSSKGKPLGIILIAISLGVKWQQVRSSSDSDLKVTVVCLQPCIRADVLVYARLRVKRL